jgi:hypothetical protein
VVNSAGQSAVPALPPGITCVAFAGGFDHSLALCSDGAVVAFGNNSAGQCDVPALPPGLVYVQVAGGRQFSLARRSDGRIVAFGANGNGQCRVAALPPGVTYVGMAAGWDHAVGRRSDGAAVAWGRNVDGECNVPAAWPAASVVEVGAGNFHTALREDAASTFTVIGSGCPGSLPTAHIVAADTPRLGTTMRMFLGDLPIDAAFLFHGWSTTTSSYGPLPLELSAFGMPGCTAFNSVDLRAVQLVTGTAGHAERTVSIPLAVVLLGVRFHQQAMVLDPVAGNPMGAVMSDSTTGIVGR